LQSSPIWLQSSYYYSQIIGAIFTVVGFIIVIIQLRQNKKAIDESTTQTKIAEDELKLTREHLQADIQAMRTDVLPFFDLQANKWSEGFVNYQTSESKYTIHWKFTIKNLGNGPAFHLELSATYVDEETKQVINKPFAFIATQPQNVTHEIDMEDRLPSEIQKVSVKYSNAYKTRYIQEWNIFLLNDNVTAWLTGPPNETDSSVEWKDYPPFQLNDVIPTDDN